MMNSQSFVDAMILLGVILSCLVLWFTLTLVNSVIALVRWSYCAVESLARVAVRRWRA